MQIVKGTNMKQHKKAKAFYGNHSEDIFVQYFPSEHGTYKANIFGPIKSPDQFSSLITVLNLMKEEDQLVLNLSSGGGCLSSVDALLHAMHHCEGSIHVVATGSVASAATFILLSAHSFELSDGFEALLHCGSLGYGANYNEVALQAPFQLAQMQKYLRTMYEGFVPEDQLNALFKGQDIMLTASQWCEWAENRQVYFQTKMEAQQAEMEQELSEESSFDNVDEEPTHTPITFTVKKPKK